MIRLWTDTHENHVMCFFCRLSSPGFLFPADVGLDKSQADAEQEKNHKKITRTLPFVD